MKEKILTKFDYKMFEKARQIAKTSTYKTYNIGCIIVYKHHIIGQASNSSKTHPKQKKYNRKYRNFKKSNRPIIDSAHAEIRALADIPYPIAESIDWSKVKVYVYRICPGKDLGMGLSRPCPACLNALRDHGIQNIYYSTDTGFAYERIF